MPYVRNTKLLSQSFAKCQHSYVIHEPYFGGYIYTHRLYLCQMAGIFRNKCEICKNTQPPKLCLCNMPTQLSYICAICQQIQNPLVIFVQMPAIFSYTCAICQQTRHPVIMIVQIANTLQKHIYHKQEVTGITNLYLC